MIPRKLREEKFPVIGKCQITGDEGMPLVKYKKKYVLKQVKERKDRQAVKPTDGDRYRDWKKRFDRWAAT